MSGVVQSVCQRINARESDLKAQKGQLEGLKIASIRQLAP